jgi:quercetin dioxygenase-like cupin family protein
MIQSKTLLDNEKVKVVEIRIPAGEKLPMHSHGRYLSYTMNPAKVKFILPDGTSNVAEYDRGVVRYAEAGITHEIENVGSTDVFNLDIELKE